MFGRNNVSKPMFDPDGRLLVHKVFDTIQGEGPDAGRPSVFLRLSKCNLRCYFCDTEFETGDLYELPQIAAVVASEARVCFRDLVVITGGEPLLQNIVPFVKQMNRMGIACSVETAGTVFYPELREVFAANRSINDNLIVCSPKTPRIAEGMEEIVGAWKYIIRNGWIDTNDGLPVASTQIEGRTSHLFRPSLPSVPIYVQPMDEQNAGKNERNLAAAVTSSLNHGYRLCVQIHKLANLE